MPGVFTPPSEPDRRCEAAYKGDDSKKQSKDKQVFSHWCYDVDHVDFRNAVDFEFFKLGNYKRGDFKGTAGPYIARHGIAKYIPD
eukprot:11440943-Alexandrium_andersonii.AAC.1